jgi:hypothetical protein
MSGICHRWLVAVLAVLLCGICSLPLRQAPAQDETPQAPQKVLVLNNGRVVSGDIEDRPGGYLIQTGIGQMVIPYTQVRLTAADVPDAYRKLKATITEPTAAAHVALGTWCFENHLYDSAREQVKAALILEPERKEARSLLKNIERIALGSEFEASIANPMPTPRMRDGFEKSEAVSLDGLSSSITQDYVRRVQPLLMNKCGNARCHGTAGTSDFRLMPVRLGMSGYRAMTDQNLTAVLGYIDNAAPQRSPLLVIPQGSHGGKGPIWTGPRADEQLAELRAWVTRVALTKPSGQATAKARAKSAGEMERPHRDPLLQQVLAEERPDAFDPAVFNRMMHGRE